MNINTPNYVLNMFSIFLIIYDNSFFLKDNKLIVIYINLYVISFTIFLLFISFL